MRYLLTAFAAILVSSVSYADTKVGGFADAQFQYLGGNDNNAATKAFVVNDGALYFSHEAGNSSVMIDVPFAISSESELAIGGAHTQAYVSQKMGSVTFSLGQMDSFYGFESNDSAQNRFAMDTGLAHALSPQSHLGASAKYSAGALGLNLVLAQGNHFAGARDMMLAQGQPGAPLQGDNPAAPDEDNMEYGAELTYGADMWNVSAGYFKGEVDGQSSSYMEAQLGFSMGQLGVTVGYNSRDMNMGDSANVMYANLGYTVNDEWSLGFRGEMAKNNGYASETQFTFGPSHKYSSNLTVRADFTYNSRELAEGAEKVNSNSVLLAGVYSL